MNSLAIRRHALTLLSTISGVVGMGIIFTGVTQGSFVEVSRGMPLLLIGLWWSGHELARSLDAAKARRERRRQVGSGSSLDL